MDRPVIDENGKGGCQPLKVGGEFQPAAMVLEVPQLMQKNCLELSFG